MKALVIGNGGREHAIVWKMAQSPFIDKIYCCPGNGGTAQIAENITVDPKDLEAMADFAVAENVALTVVGPDAYLAMGTVDIFQKRGLKVYGPTQAAARLESSKAFAKDFMKKYHIPTADFATFDDPREAREYIRAKGAPIVVKADGLAAGKGVVVALDLDTALGAVEEIMTQRIFGESGEKIVVEEYLSGEEVSLLAFCDGKTAVPMIPVQDHKRIGEGDTGPNTGGMGTYAPTTLFTEELAKRVTAEILEPTMQGMQAEGAPFSGTLFLGLMITAAGPKVIEYNARFGDPETQVVLPLLESDVVPIFMDAVNGTLHPDTVHWKRGYSAVCVVAASKGYPGKFAMGKPITGLENVKDSIVFQAGTKRTPDGSVLTSGGRVLNIVHLGQTIHEAADGAYRDLNKIGFEGMVYRNDIAWRELNRVHE